jgi:glutamine amidotransferase-like uncharacterized protein
MSVRVYTGSGSNRNGAPLLIEELARHLNCDVYGIDQKEIRESTAWQKETTALIFAGQSVGMFKEALGEDGMQRIRQGIHSGAFDYIGICAGAAFAASHIKYRMKPVKPEHPDIKISNTGLSLHYLLATGPCRSVSPLPYSGEQENLFLVDLLDTEDFSKYNAFFWGGPAIIPMESCSIQQRKYLALLKKDATPLALRSKFGEGNVSLFAFHPEINANNIGRWAGIRNLSNDKALLLENMAKDLDGTAFMRFLRHAGLERHIAYERKAAFAAPRYNFDLL